MHPRAATDPARLPVAVRRPRRAARFWQRNRQRLRAEIEAELREQHGSVLLTDAERDSEVASILSAPWAELGERSIDEFMDGRHGVGYFGYTGKPQDIMQPAIGHAPLGRARAQ